MAPKTVKVTFSMIEGCSQDDPHQRTITLTEGSVFEVGRASRSETRPAKATRENLWLNSPVVSRSHAELLLRFEPDPQICIVDLQTSMHGTKVNGLFLSKGHEWILEDGDEVQFGNAVTTSRETFPAPRFRFNFDGTPGTPPGTPPAYAGASFSVPVDEEGDGSDMPSIHSESSESLWASQRAHDIILDHDKAPERNSMSTEIFCSRHLGNCSSSWNISDEVEEPHVSLSSSFPSGQRPKSDFLYEEAIRRQEAQKNPVDSTSKIQAWRDRHNIMSIQSPLPHIIANPDGCIRFEKAPTTNDEHSKLNGKERIAIGNICDQHDKEGDMVSRTPGTKDVSTPLEKSGDAAQLGAPSLVPSNQPQTAAPTLSKEPYMSLSTESTASSSSIEAAEISAGSNPTASSPIVNEATGGGRLDIADSFQGKLQGSSIPKSSIAEPEPLTWKRKVAQMNDFGLAEYTPTLSVDGRAKKTMRGCKLSRENKSPHIEPKATEPKVTDRAATVEEPRRKKIKTNPIAKFAKVVMPAAFLGAVVGGAATFIGLASMAE